MHVKVIEGIGIGQEYARGGETIIGAMEHEIHLSGNVCEVIAEGDISYDDLPISFAVKAPSQNVYIINKAMVAEVIETDKKKAKTIAKKGERKIQKNKYKAPQYIEPERNEEQVTEQSTSTVFINKLKAFIQKYQKTTKKDTLSYEDMELVYDKIEDLIFIFYNDND